MYSMDLNLIATGTATCASQDQMSIAVVNCFNSFAFHAYLFLVGRICNNFKKNHAFYDKSMKLGICLVDSYTK